MEPNGRGQQGAHQSGGQILRIAREGRGVDNAFSDGIRNMASGQKGPGELEDGGENHCAGNGEGFGANGVGHGIRNIVRSDVPRHVKPYDDGDSE